MEIKTTWRHARPEITEGWCRDPNYKKPESPVLAKRRKPVPVKVNGVEYESCRAAANALGYEVASVYNMVSRTGSRDIQLIPKRHGDRGVRNVKYIREMAKKNAKSKEGSQQSV